MYLSNFAKHRNGNQQKRRRVTTVHQFLFNTLIVTANKKGVTISNPNTFQPNSLPHLGFF